MVKIERSVWAILDIIGMILLAVGALGVMDIIPLGQTASTVLLAVGIAMIIISSVFIQLDGMKLRKEHDEFIRFNEIRKNVRLVPNDLKEGYVIDYTAEPSRAISYRKNEAEAEDDGPEEVDGGEEDILIADSS